MRARFIALSLLVIATLVPAPAHARKRALEGVVNMNTASPDELQLLPGVGPAKVRDILAYRAKHPFRTPEEIVRIKGIGRKMFRRLRLHLAVSGPTTAQQVIRADPPPADSLEPPAALRRPVPLLPPPRPGSPPAARRPTPRPIAFPDADANHCLRKP